MNFAYIQSCRCPRFYFPLKAPPSSIVTRLELVERLHGLTGTGQDTEDVEADL